jgi:hypothetical protein
VISLARAEAKVQLLQEQLNQRIDKERLDSAKIQAHHACLDSRAVVVTGTAGCYL